MHLRSATFKDRGCIRLFLIQHWYHMIMFGFWDWNTQRHKQKIWTSSSTLKSMIHQIVTLAIWGRGHCEGEGTALWSIYYRITLHFPKPIKKRPEVWNGFHLGFSPFECRLKTLSPASLYPFNIKSALCTVQTTPALIHHSGIPRHKMRFIIIYVVGY